MQDTFDKTIDTVSYFYSVCGSGLQMKMLVGCAMRSSTGVQNRSRIKIGRGQFC
jgi:hypothetical protein